MPVSFDRLLHPYSQLTILVLSSVMALYLSNPVALMTMLLGVGLYACLLVSPKVMLKIYGLLLLLNMMMLGSINFLASYIPNYVTGSFINQSIPFLRMAITISASVAIAFGTPIDHMLLTLRKMRLPRWMTLPLSVAIRFIPTFIDDIKQLSDINYIRFNGLHPMLWPLKPFKLWRRFCVPLIFRTFYSSDALAISAELKGFGQRDIVMRKTMFKGADYRLLLLIITLSLLSLYLEQKMGPVASLHGGRG